MRKNKSKIVGNLDIIVIENQDEFEGEIMKWKQVLIQGDPEGLRSFARLLLNLADLDQDNVDDLPAGAREHIHLKPKNDLSLGSDEVIVGRLDAKGTGAFYYRFISKY